MNIQDKAQQFALSKHTNQKYGEYPYSYHLSYVVNILKEYGYGEDNIIICSAWLHDTIEDTDTTYEMLVSEFNQEIADTVYAVTNEPGKNRMEKFSKTAPKIIANKKALILKLADRITNTEFNLENDSRIYQVYCREFPQFKQLLYRGQDIDILPMWNRLISLSDGGTKYLETKTL
jgi:guanosine-3',5'-bis(diphosphate) 3'-pyrophosphohydrolase